MIGAGNTIGAHTHGHNTTTHAIAVIGNFDVLTADDVLVGDLAALRVHGGDQGGWQPRLLGGHRDAHPDVHDDLLDPQLHYLDRGVEFLVGIIGEGLVAMGAYLPVDTETVQIKRMRVAPEQQHRGYGRRILAELESRAIRQGFTKATLDTTVEQIAAQRRYSSSGYLVMGHGQLGHFETVQFARKLT
jgi:GNAT superfamily N-acetyltransferase